MFYNHDILSRRKTGLGIVWLAATLGDRSIVRRLTRKDILTVNIAGACEYVRRPTEPLSLRLSSQLMYGVVKLFLHRTQLLYNDVSNVHNDVRRTMVMGERMEVRDIDMKKGMVGRDKITMELDLAFFTLDFDAVAMGMMYRWSVEPMERRAREEEVDSEDGFRAQTPVSFAEEEERITLAGRGFEEDELGLPRGFGDENDFGPVLGDSGFDEDDAEGLDLGLEGAEMPAMRPEVMIPGAPEGIQRRYVGYETTASIGPMLEWPELEERLTEEAARMDIGPIIDGVPTVTPSRRRRDEEEAAELEASLGLAPRRPRPAQLFDDQTTILSDDEMRAARSNYPQRMAMARALREAGARNRAADATVRQAMFGPPEDMSLDPMLAEMWQTTVGEHLVSRRARFLEMRAEATLAPADDLPPANPPPTPMELDEEEAAEVGVARAAAAGPEIPAALRGARESLPWNVFMEHRRRSSMMPSVSYDRPPTIEREATPLRLREVSVETPTGLCRLPPHESPVFPPGSPSSVAPLEIFDFPPPSLPGTPSVERFRLGLPTAATAATGIGERSPTPPSQIFQKDIEEETRNFREYARSIRAQLEDPNFLFFSDLAPVASSTPAVAAQAFYHTLALASRGRIKVKQEEAYQEIHIQLLGA
ncbi:meiotic cohesin complex subunit Rec8 [Pseudozyma hubeiensis SY62]|uniref:Meiotic cohesin complex subunit Rec8 n=1 Tax=Pseudozyma hubeiensis (strain SY62) TaxID=1305764 RepID=R9P5Y6_PSEHS|nr:meiotic cohesin complex subunit Rec8 [Pseudozyma hubeiensis SY62]WJN25043.1 meiotic cohesin complex subunit [Moesziomyces parantarcticus]GAC96744.1 meiotic cohesin complex subunit Rec8 [Pseudozyma hubeiensis SY62]DBA11405.1 TPA_inf: REC8 [Pseudozyma hubeiensis]